MYTRIVDFLEDWREESARTARIMNALTDAALAQPVSPDDRTLGRIAWHVVTSIPEMLARTGLEPKAVNPELPVPGTAAEIATAYVAAAAEAAQLIEQQWDDATLAVADNMYGEDWPRGVTLQVLLRHELHHRAQMTVLMRQAGLAVPGIYGPAREDWAKFGMRPPAI